MKIHHQTNLYLPTEMQGEALEIATKLNKFFSVNKKAFLAIPSDNKGKHPDYHCDVTVIHLSADGKPRKNINNEYAVQSSIVTTSSTYERKGKFEMKVNGNGDLVCGSTVYRIPSDEQCSETFSVEGEPIPSVDAKVALEAYESQIDSLSERTVHVKERRHPNAHPYDPVASNKYEMGKRMEEGVAISITKAINEDMKHPLRCGRTGLMVAMATSQIRNKWMNTPEWGRVGKSAVTRKGAVKEQTVADNEEVRIQDDLGIDIVLMPAEMFMMETYPFNTYDVKDFITIQAKMEPTALLEHGNHYIEVSNLCKTTQKRVPSGLFKTEAYWWCFIDSAKEVKFIPTIVLRNEYNERNANVSVTNVTDESKTLGYLYPCSAVLFHKSTCSTVLSDKYRKAFKQYSINTAEKTIYSDEEGCVKNAERGAYRYDASYHVGQDLSVEEQREMLRGMLPCSKLRKLDI